METIQCPACGTLNPLEKSVCQDCGEDLSTVKSVIDAANRHYNQALALAQSGRLDEAAGQLEAAIAMSSHNLNYYLLLGTVHAQNQRWDEAIETWERCLSLNPDTEKAYRNIEKAQQMQEEENAERRDRPFFLTAIFAVIVAVFLLGTTGFYAFQAYAKNKQIGELMGMVDAKNNEAISWQQKYNTLNANFPQDGLQGLLAQLNQWKTLADQRAVSIEQLEKRYKDAMDTRNQEVQQSQTQVQNLEEQVANLKQTLTQINPLRYNLTMKTKESETLQQTVTDLNATLETEKQKTAQLTSQLEKAHKEIAALKANSLVSLDQSRTESDKKIEAQRQQIQQLLDEIGQKDRRLADIQYAGNLVIEAIGQMESNQFSEASALIQKALERRNDDPIALYYQKILQNIVSNPIERELRIQLNNRQNELREQIRTRLAGENLSRARELLGQGQFERAIDTARQTMAFLPADSETTRQCSQLIRQAEEDEATIIRQLSEVRGYVEKQDVRKAKALLKDILRRAPSYEEANALMQELGA